MRSPSILSFFSSTTTIVVVVVVVFFCHCDARDSINVTSPLSDIDQTLVSAGNIFELGFFTPENSNNRYVGIWYYNLVPRTIVWVANRDTPCSDLSTFFGVAEDGNINVWCGSRDPYPITNLDLQNSTTLQLLDSGNLRLLGGGQKGQVLWQSFDNPTDTFLPGMKMNDNMRLTSWINQSDPGSGNYIFKRDQGVYIIQNMSSLYWKSSEPSIMSYNFDELPNVAALILSGVNTSSTDQENNQLSIGRKNNTLKLFPNGTRTFHYNNTRILMNSAGEIQFYSIVNRTWSLVWSEPSQGSCSLYDVCGKFAMCGTKENDTTICQCLPGFKSSFSSETWRVGEYLDGCDRESILLCSNNATFNNTSQEHRFVNVSLKKVGSQVEPFDKAQEEEMCKAECLRDCKCEAYSFKGDNVTNRQTETKSPRCWIWRSEIRNVQQDFSGDGLRLHLRVSLSPIASLPTNVIENSMGPKNNSKKRYVIVFTVLVAGVMLVSGSTYILYRRRRRRNANATGNHQSTLDYNETEGIDVPFYNLDTIISATDNFSNANKLGEGGFGPVYKGKFPGGCEIAVKRLSSCSGQGIEEFRNEVILIAKLQHRNLVRLLGYCINGNEKILLYEYMPNRSLDAFIFDRHNCLLLDWKKRLEIILGIARGLMYLHQDSRLRIIHRDLKTSNILLDEDMNPKISDFGLARIIEGKGTEASTTKVVGTYGYMSPEYALDGKFSTKSDVFSFGIVMLEIISGKKTTGFYNKQEAVNLLSYVWKFWNENKAMDLVDQTLVESCVKSQVIKCINVGLLCVQEDPDDRPSMSTVVIMLGSEYTPPNPSQPAFIVRRRLSSTSSSTSTTKPEMYSTNELTVSIAEGR